MLLPDYFPQLHPGAATLCDFLLPQQHRKESQQKQTIAADGGICTQQTLCCKGFCGKKQAQRGSQMPYTTFRI